MLHKTSGNDLSGKKSRMRTSARGARGIMRSKIEQPDPAGETSNPRGVVNVALGYELYKEFSDRCARLGGNPTHVLKQFAKTALAKPAREVREWLYDWEDDEEYNTVRLYGNISAGNGIEVIPLEEQIHVQLPEGVRATPTRYALRVLGDSMDGLSGHSIVDGMIALFDAAKPAFNGCVAHVEWEDAGTQYCTVKKLMYREGSEEVILKPTNPKYEPKTKRWNEINVCGVMVTGWQPES